MTQNYETQSIEADVTRQSRFWSIAQTFSAKAAGAAIGLVTSILAARALGPEGRGQFATAATIAAIGAQLANMGLHSSNTYFLAQDRSRLPKLVGNSAVVSVGLGGLAAAGIAMCIWLFGLGADLPRPLTTLAVVMVPVSIAYMLLSNLLLGMSEISRFNANEIGFRVAGLVLVAFAFMAGSTNPASYLLAGLLAQALALIGVWLSLGQPLSSLSSFSPPLLREQVPFAFRTYLNCLLVFLVMRSDVLLVQWKAGNAEAGHYSIAVAMADVIYMLAAAAGQVMFPRLVATADPAERKAAAIQVLAEIGVGMAVLAALAGAVAAPAVTLFFGASFSPAASVFHILVVGTVINGMNSILSNYLAAEGMPWHAVWVWLLGLVVDVALNLLLIPRMGGHGAAIASIAGFSVVLAVQAWFVFGRKEGAS